MPSAVLTSTPGSASDPTGEPEVSQPGTAESAATDAIGQPTPASVPSSPATSATSGAPAVLMKTGSRGDRVRELQHRLLQLAWFEGPLTGTYDPATQAGVEGFQAKRGLVVTGLVDTRTWQLLTSMTRMPSHDEMYNVLKPGPALFDSGATGDGVKDLQARLKQVGWLSGPVTGTYGPATTAAVRGFQGKRQIPVTGAVDQRTLDRLRAMTHQPTADELANKPPKAVPRTGQLDARCMTGRVLCISKRTHTLSWVVDGKVQLVVDVRFGSEANPTREGMFTVGWKSRDHVSNLYHTKMPFAMFFSGGQAVHYSADFAARGYSGASHGCVNVRNHDAVQWLFGQVNVGDQVYVFS